METSNGFIALGNALFLIAVTMRADRLRLSRELSLLLALLMLIGAIIGARVLYLVLHEISFGVGLSLLSAHRGGFSYIGAIMGAALMLLFFARILRKSALILGGEIAPIWCLMSALWRVRCHFAGCCHGSTTSNAFFTGLGAFTHSGAPKQIPLPAVEIVFLLLLSLWLSKGSAKIASEYRLNDENRCSLVVGSYFAAYLLFRVIAEYWR